MKVYYVWDAYCGWCYGFEKVLIPFLEKNADLDVELISGGLFFDKRMSEYPQMLEINEQIADIFNVEFGERYKKLFVENTAINSLHPAQAISVVRKYISKKELIRFIYDIQKEFYVKGRVLSDISVYVDIAEKYNLDIEKIKEEILEQFSEGKTYHSDFLKVQELGVQGFPSVLLEKDDKIYNLRNGALTLEQLERNYEVLKNK